MLRYTPRGIFEHSTLAENEIYLVNVHVITP